MFACAPDLAIPDRHSERRSLLYNTRAHLLVHDPPRPRYDHLHSPSLPPRSAMHDCSQDWA